MKQHFYRAGAGVIPRACLAVTASAAAAVASIQGMHREMAVQSITLRNGFRETEKLAVIHAHKNCSSVIAGHLCRSRIRLLQYYSQCPQLRPGCCFIDFFSGAAGLVTQLGNVCSCWCLSGVYRNHHKISASRQCLRRKGAFTPMRLNRSGLNKF